MGLELIQLSFPVNWRWEHRISAQICEWLSPVIYFSLGIWCSISDQIHLEPSFVLSYFAFLNLSHGMLETYFNCLIAPSTRNTNGVHKTFKSVWPTFPRRELKNQIFLTIVISIACKLDHIKTWVETFFFHNLARSFIHLIYWVLCCMKERTHRSSRIH